MYVNMYFYRVALTLIIYLKMNRGLAIQSNKKTKTKHNINTLHKRALT